MPDHPRSRCTPFLYEHRSDCTNCLYKSTKYNCSGPFSLFLFKDDIMAQGIYVFAASKKKTFHRDAHSNIDATIKKKTRWRFVFKTHVTFCINLSRSGGIELSSLLFEFRRFRSKSLISEAMNLATFPMTTELKLFLRFGSEIDLLRKRFNEYLLVEKSNLHLFSRTNT